MNYQVRNFKVQVQGLKFKVRGLITSAFGLQPLAFLTPLASLLLVAGCSSPALQGNRTVRLLTDPEGARVVLTDKDGTALWTGETPTDIPLKLEVGQYRLSLEKPGYFPVSTGINGS